MLLALRVVLHHGIIIIAITVMIYCSLHSSRLPSSNEFPANNRQPFVSTISLASTVRLPPAAGSPQTIPDRCPAIRKEACGSFGVSRLFRTRHHCSLLLPYSLSFTILPTVPRLSTARSFVLHPSPGTSPVPITLNLNLQPSNNPRSHSSTPHPQLTSRLCCPR